MPDPNPPSEDASVAAILAQRSRADRNELLDELVAMLSSIVPGVQVERTLLRRQITAVRLPVGGYLYVLKKSSSDNFDASRQQVVHGVVVRTIPLEIDAFLAELGVALDEELRRTEKGRKALAEWLSSTNG